MIKKKEKKGKKEKKEEKKFVWRREGMMEERVPRTIVAVRNGPTLALLTLKYPKIFPIRVHISPKFPPISFKSFLGFPFLIFLFQPFQFYG